MKKINIVNYSLSSPRLPGKAALRLCFISDLHNDLSDKKEGFILRSIADNRPDVILCGGDLLSAKAGSYEFEKVPPFLKKLTKLSPVYISSGNHELRLKALTGTYKDAYERYMGEIEKTGVIFLNDCSVEISDDFAVTGYSLPLDKYIRSRRGRLSIEEMRSQLPKPDRSKYNILLVHHPDYFTTYTRWGADLCLAGHLHGGIVRVPGLGGVFGATYRPFPKYDKGLFREGKGTMIVSAGLGSHFIKARPFNPLELVFVEIGHDI